MPMTTAYAVAGMTCGHCVAAVTEEIAKIGGVERIAVDLVAGGDSTVTVISEAPLTEEDVREAIDEAGYTLTGTHESGRSD
jgi:copper chaperone